jgi:hypothetical protein
MNQLAALVVKVATEGRPEANGGKDPAAVARGRKGGKAGGPARARSLSRDKLRKIARKAARARWSKRRG